MSDVNRYIAVLLFTVQARTPGSRQLHREGRHLRDLEAYRRFDPQLDGEPL